MRPGIVGDYAAFPSAEGGTGLTARQVAGLVVLHALIGRHGAALYRADRDDVMEQYLDLVDTAVTIGDEFIKREARATRTHL